ncbi:MULTISPECIES: hypothetical protein [unclassified Solwaraspora]|uniref:hypothetical protein n=1 Tax=unclassified Solwaraspora TaxID=2627926 RepID=UPI00259B576F|nr:hypothetical protein [Solwaraspora sp. WMMA2056]WJK40920.1 hypothetical protein O7608_00155 [Solwaraspora sp. WMMA2056]
MDKISPRRLRSTSVQLGALTALALSLSGCNMVSDDDCDDDRSMGVGGGGTAVVALAAGTLTTGSAADLVDRAGSAAPTAAVPDRGGFGTHLASCGG